MMHFNFTGKLFVNLKEEQVTLNSGSSSVVVEKLRRTEQDEPLIHFRGAYEVCIQPDGFGWPSSVLLESYPELLWPSWTAHKTLIPLRWDTFKKFFVF